MSTLIDSRVAEMRFDNRNFERNVATSMSTLDKLKEKLKLKELKKERNKQRELARAKKKFGINTLENTTSNFSLSQQEAQVLLKLAKQVVGKDNSVIYETEKENIEKETKE